MTTADLSKYAESFGKLAALSKSQDCIECARIGPILIEEVKLLRAKA